MPTNERRQRKATTARHPARACYNCYISEPTQQQNLGYNFQRHFLLLFSCDTSAHTLPRSHKKHTLAHASRRVQSSKSRRSISHSVGRYFFYLLLMANQAQDALIVDRARSRSRTPRERNTHSVVICCQRFCAASLLFQIHFSRSKHTHTHAHINARTLLSDVRGVLEHTQTGES